MTLKLDRLNTFMTLSLLAGSLTACAVTSGRETMGEYMDDATITAKVKTSILNDPNLHLFQIHVETFQGTVQLSGFVDSISHAKKAEQLAREIKGVRNVKNTIVIR